MQSNKVEEKIIEKIQEITDVNLDINEQVCLTLTNKTRDFRIKKILIFSSSYDFFLLEEEGRLRNIFLEWSNFSENYNPPTITHIEHEKELFDHIDQSHYDLIILFNISSDLIQDLSKNIKEKTNTPLILLHNNVHELSNIRKKLTNIDKYFTWNGDGIIIASIVSYFEDKINITHQNKSDRFKCIALIEDSIQYYSSYFTMYTEELNKYMKQVITDNVSCEQREKRFQQRPYFLHTDNYDEAIELFHSYNNHIQFIISDNFLETGKEKKTIGIDLANLIQNQNKKTPILIQSSEKINKDILDNKQAIILLKTSANLMKKVREFMKVHMGIHPITIKQGKKKELRLFHSISEFKDSLKTLNDSSLKQCVANADFSKWLYSLSELDLAEKCTSIEQNCSNAKEIKDSLFELIEQYQYAINQTTISHFSQRSDDPEVKISRIGKGSLGGKARGLAFLAKIISKYQIQDIFPTLQITIPRSIVLSTDVFDMFMEYNHHTNLDFSMLSDERISSKFVKSSLPPTILGDLRSFIRDTRKPLIIRSSGLLEDSLLQPFAGIYASMLLPNDSWETDLRFQEVCNAIKHVFSSTYFSRARTYIKSTSKHLADEKMAVLIQEIVGERHGNYFYPTISGVAKSYNYYPSSSCKPEEGIAYLALGLGKAIVDGGSSFAFCPEKPKKPLSGTAKEFIKYAQTYFYALNLKSIHKYVNVDEDTSLDKLDLEIAKKHGILDNIVSTYIYQDDQIYPGIYEGGPLVVDFGPIVQYNSIPLSKAISLLLNISEIILGYPVEIEFAVNIAKKEDAQSELVILQIRSMIPPDKQIDVNIDDINPEHIVASSKNCLGYGITSDIHDIVYINQESFDMSKSVQIVEDIRRINEKLMDEKIPYLLIGPGRWGSSDHWLGIPVQWSDIAGARAIIETPYKERHIDPSQGSHFFHDMIASDVLYLITKKPDDIIWEKITQHHLVEQNEFIQHVKSKNAFEIIVDGTTGKGAVIQKNKKG